ncbi:MAG: type II toxin-antitoxin system RelE/ParE family toxin [Armatimonadetes bacterium]|nr:type II toxin-antitoxin system RelE/ParE family toxin [Armatimonadota bacterium]
MDVVIRDRKLRKAYESGRAGWHQPAVVQAFGALMSVLGAASSHDDVLALQQFRIHPLGEDRAGQYAAHLSGNYRAVFELGRDDQGQFVEIIEVVDYH